MEINPELFRKLVSQWRPDVVRYGLDTALVVLIEICRLEGLAGEAALKAAVEEIWLNKKAASGQGS